MENVFKIVKTIVKIISDIAFILVLGYFIVFIPMIFSFKPLTVEEVHSSNVPFKMGALVYYKKVELSSLHKKDIILYEEGEKNYKIYAVTNIDDGNIYISDDESYSIDDISGKVAPIYIPYYGKYISFMNHHMGLLYFLCALVIIDFVAGMIIGSFKSTYRKSRLVS